MIPAGLIVVAGRVAVVRIRLARIVVIVAGIVVVVAWIGSRSAVVARIIVVRIVVTVRVGRAIEA